MHFINKTCTYHNKNIILLIIKPAHFDMKNVLIKVDTYTPIK